MGKKLFAILVAISMLVAGCAGLQIGKPDTLAKYYTTTYWGPEVSCPIEDFGTMIGRPWKTYQVFPETDLPFVKEYEKRGKEDKVTVNMVWDSLDTTALGVCFDIENPDGTPGEYCGVAMFLTADDKIKWQMEYEGTGENVLHLIEVVHSLPYMRAELNAQIEASEHMVVGDESADVCTAYRSLIKSYNKWEEEE